LISFNGIEETMNKIEPGQDPDWRTPGWELFSNHGRPKGLPRWNKNEWLLVGTLGVKKTDLSANKRKKGAEQEPPLESPAKDTENTAQAGEEELLQPINNADRRAEAFLPEWLRRMNRP
jgi:hypothetical protein